jgi:hypothetical protein
VNTIRDFLIDIRLAMDEVYSKKAPLQKRHCYYLARPVSSTSGSIAINGEAMATIAR